MNTISDIGSKILRNRMKINDAMKKYAKKYMINPIEPKSSTRNSMMDKMDIGAPTVYKLLYVCSLIFSPKFFPLNAIWELNNISKLKMKVARYTNKI